MTWNYRICYVDGNYGVYEVYYKDGIPVGRTSKPVQLCSSELQDIMDDIKLLQSLSAVDVLEWP